jgi:hypothetical protein
VCDNARVLFSNQLIHGLELREPPKRIAFLRRSDL